MTMYTYFSSVKSGKYLLRSQFWYNRRTCAFLSQTHPLWCVLSSPVGLVLDKLKWYWTDKNSNELKSHEHILYTRDKLADGDYDEMWYPKPHPTTGHYNVNRDVMSTHENFYECCDDILSRDIITNPFNLLGYTGNLGSEKMQQRLLDQRPNLVVPPHIIKELRKRVNIVAYKENIEHLAYNFFTARGRLQFEQQCEWINNTIKFQKLIPVILQRYNIPYEMFSLDTGDYAITFGLDKTLPRDSSDTLFQAPNPDADDEVKKYMDLYHTS